MELIQECVMGKGGERGERGDVAGGCCVSKLPHLARARREEREPEQVPKAAERPEHVEDRRPTPEEMVPAAEVPERERNTEGRLFLAFSGGTIPRNQDHKEVNVNWVRGKNAVYGAGAECGGRRPKPAKGVQPKGGMSSADPSGTLLASLSSDQDHLVIETFVYPLSL